MYELILTVVVWLALQDLRLCSLVMSQDTSANGAHLKAKMLAAMLLITINPVQVTDGHHDKCSLGTVCQPHAACLSYRYVAEAHLSVLSQGGSAAHGMPAGALLLPALGHASS